MHQLDQTRTQFWKQSPNAIDAGAFHNDVVAVANESVLFCHELAFENQTENIQSLRELYESVFNEPFVVIQVSNDELPLQEAVKTYLFNSQIVTTTDRQMVLIAPMECKNSPQAKAVIDRVLAAENPVNQVFFPDVRQSMDNGGGPACLRLRVVMNENQMAELNQSILFSDSLESSLKMWIEKNYREQLDVKDLGDPGLYTECRDALIELEQILEFETGALVPR